MNGISSLNLRLPPPAINDFLTFFNGSTSFTDATGELTKNVFDTGGGPKLPTPKNYKAILIGASILAVGALGYWAYRQFAPAAPAKPKTDPEIAPEYKELDPKELARKAIEDDPEGKSQPIRKISTTPQDKNEEQPKDCEEEWLKMAKYYGFTTSANYLNMTPITCMINFDAMDIKKYPYIWEKNLPYYNIIRGTLCRYTKHLSTDCAITLMKRVLEKAGLSHLLDSPTYDLNKMLDECE